MMPAGQPKDTGWLEVAKDERGLQLFVPGTPSEVISQCCKPQS